MCYTAPIVAGIATTLIWKKNRSHRLWWLNLMFYGSALFGAIDHLWNGELFLISKDWVKDLGLGLVITAGTILAWGIVLYLAKRTFPLNAYLANSEAR
jgi:hypothetical protein